MIITGCNETLDRDSIQKSFSEDKELNRTFQSMRNTLRNDLKDIKEIKW